jgi:DNA-binding XRE family transcriptional regulator
MARRRHSLAARRKAVGLSQEGLAHLVGVDRSTVVRWERADTEPQPWHRPKLARALKVSVEELAVLLADVNVMPPTTSSVSDVDRQQFFRLTGTVMALPWLDLLGPTEPTPIPAKVGRAEIEQVRTAATVFESWQNVYGGGLARETVVAQLRWSAQLLHADCPENLRPELFAAVATCAGVAGFMAFDAGVHDDARRAFRFGLACAERSGDWHVRSCLLHDMAVQAVSCGRLDEALTHAELALVRAERLTLHERARLHTVRARAYAKLHRTQDALATVGAADEAFARGKPSEGPPWMTYYDYAEHHSESANALFDLSVAGAKATEAGQRFAYAVENFGGAYVRSRAMSRTKLASLHMATGDPHQGAVIGNQALDEAADLSSRRVADDLRELRRHASRHSAIPVVRELGERITETLGA